MLPVIAMERIKYGRKDVIRRQLQKISTTNRVSDWKNEAGKFSGKGGTFRQEH